MPEAQTIQDVIDRLTEIIAEARAEQSRIGYFPALYRRVTVAVRDGIAANRFADPARMEKLDVVFANRYLRAYDGWRAGQPISLCWALAFRAAAATDRIITQHLLLGMNAHINLDLAVAAATVAPGDAIHALHGDFMKINQILSEQVDGVQEAIASVSPAMWMLDTIGGKADEKLVEFSMDKARGAAWAQSAVMAKLDGLEREAAIAGVDAAVTAIGEGVYHPPGFIVRATLRAIVRSEAQDVVRIIDALQ